MMQQLTSGNEGTKLQRVFKATALSSAFFISSMELL